MVADYIPDRGDIVWLSFEPHIGHEQAGVRPAIVISSQRYNRKAQLMIACPITSKIKNYPFEVKLKTRNLTGVILADQVKSLDWTIRKPKFAEKAPLDALKQTQDLIALLVNG